MKISRITAVLGIAAAPALAAPVPLAENAHITESLVAAQTADILRNECSSISARMLVFYQKAKELESYARAEGYAEAEVKAFLKDKEQKARIKALATAHLAEAGAKAGDEESYCAAGRAEIAAGTLAGSLLMSWK